MQLEHTVSAHVTDIYGRYSTGYEIEAVVTFPTGRVVKSPICLCKNQDDALEIAELLNAKYTKN